MSPTLLYVVGPSGAGKDSLLAWLKARWPAPAPVHWTRRTIDRPLAADSNAEQHESVTTAQFEALVAADRFALHWAANGHRYGIRREEMHPPGHVRWLIVNGSRAYLGHAAATNPGLTVLHITASKSVLRDRLIRRDREAPDAIEARLDRQVPLALPTGCGLIEVSNDGLLEIAGQQVLMVLENVALTRS